MDGDMTTKTQRGGFKLSWRSLFSVVEDATGGVDSGAMDSLAGYSVYRRVYRQTWP